MKIQKDYTEELMKFAAEHQWTVDRTIMLKSLWFILTAIYEIDHPEGDYVLRYALSVLERGATQEDTQYNVCLVKYITTARLRTDYECNKMLMNPFTWDYRFYLGIIAKYFIENDRYKTLYREIYQGK